MEQIDENFWDSRYQSEQTGWDIGQVSPPLKKYIQTITDRNTAILIPGCGNAYEASFLLDQGFRQVTLLDISSVLVERLKKRFEGQAIRVLHDDFFRHSGSYDLLLEQTFFCAIAPSLRPDYVRQAWHLLRPGGKIAGVLFNENIGYDDRPPFRGSEAAYRTLFTPYFLIHRLEDSTDSIGPRMGNELFIVMERRDEPL